MNSQCIHLAPRDVFRSVAGNEIKAKCSHLAERDDYTVNSHLAERDEYTRRGVTLIELLVVMLIVLIVSAMTMTLAAPALDSRRIRESARMVEVMINKARNRALQTGRPAGIWIERMPQLPEASVSLAFAEVPEVYGGDFPNSGVTVVVEKLVGSTGTLTGPPGPEEKVAIVMPHLTDPRDRTTAYQQSLIKLDVWATPDPKIQQVIRPGDSIQFNLMGPRIVLETTDAHPVVKYRSDLKARYNGQPQWYVARALRRVDANGRFVVDSNGYWIYDWFHNGIPNAYNALVFWNGVNDGSGNIAISGELSTSTNLSSDTGASGLPVRYRIFRQPLKSAAGAIALPDGAVIDLNYSGTRRLNFHPRLAASYSDPTTNQRVFYGRPPNPYCGYDWRWTNPPTAMAPPQYPSDNSPIVIMFTSDGLVEQAYLRSWQPFFVRPGGAMGSGQGSWEWQVTKIYEPIHLLIGKREKLPAPTTFADQLQANWTDTANLWVTINAQTGFISTTENASVPTDVALTGLRGHGTAWGDGSPPPNDASFYNMDLSANGGRQKGFINGLDHLGFGARRIANMQQIMGGR